MFKCKFFSIPGEMVFLAVKYYYMKGMSDPLNYWAGIRKLSYKKEMRIALYLLQALIKSFKAKNHILKKQTTYLD